MKQVSYFLRIVPSLLVFSALLFSCKQNGETEVENISNVDSTNVENLEIIENDLVDGDRAELLVEQKDDSKLNPAQLQIQRLLESCAKGDYASAAKTIMYRGKDTARAGKDYFRYENANEANTVKVTCDVIKAWLGSSASYEFISYKEEQTDLGLQHQVEVLFTKEKIGIERHFFILVQSPEGLLLVNMI
ncbi:MAG: hypothetical protein KDC82_07195 [Bacteroidetes bacterium]|nr:hypothetical protein [Bacteroidota bacterium]